MPWTRDLGIVATDEVATKVAQATADARGLLTDADAARRQSLLDRLGSGEEVPQQEVAELQRLNRQRAVKMSPEDLATIDKATELAEAGVRIMGGRAHVSLGGSDRVDDQPESPIKGRHTSITVTVTDMHDYEELAAMHHAKAEAASLAGMAPPSPAKVEDTGLDLAPTPPRTERTEK